jgi:hypothetical protein
LSLLRQSPSNKANAQREEFLLDQSGKEHQSLFLIAHLIDPSEDTVTLEHCDAPGNTILLSYWTDAPQSMMTPIS